MRIPSLAILTVFLVCLGHAHAQPFDTFYVVSQYRIKTDFAGPPHPLIGNSPMQVYLPDSQQVTLFAKKLGKKRYPPKRLSMSNPQTHCLRIVKQHNSACTIRIVTGDSFYKWRGKLLSVDTTLTITEVPFNRNIVTDHYRAFKKIIIHNQYYYMSYIPYKKERKRKRFLKWFLRPTQYEYNMVTQRLTQLY